jgi:hypothetical protein
MGGKCGGNWVAKRVMGIHGHAAHGLVARPMAQRFGPAQGTRPCLAHHPGTQHSTSMARSNEWPGSGPIKMNCWCSYDLYICVINCYIG